MTVAAGFAWGKCTKFSIGETQMGKVVKRKKKCHGSNLTLTITPRHTSTWIDSPTLVRQTRMLLTGNEWAQEEIPWTGTGGV